MENNAADIVQVIRRILEQFSHDELLNQVSFVNKLWNYEARCVMRQRGNTVAYFEHDCRRPYENFTAFGTDLLQMNVAPFYGVHFGLKCELSRSSEHAPCPPVALDPRIFDRLTVKEISIKKGRYWQNHEGCQGLMLINRFLQHYGQDLEMFSLEYLPVHEVFTHLQHCNFPRLKVFKFEWNRLLDPTFTSFIKLLVSRAPHLQELHCAGGPIHLLGNLLEGSSALLVYSDYVECHHFDLIPDSMLGALRLENINLCYTGSGFNLDRFQSIAPIVLQASLTTLQALKIDAVLAVLFMCYKFCFKNVQQFEVYIDYQQMERIEPRLLRIVKEFHFTQIFPRLKKVTVDIRRSSRDISPDHVNKIINVSDAVLEEISLHPALHIEKLGVLGALSNATVQFLAEMFPGVHRLSVKHFDREKVPFGCIWKHWKDLKQFKVCVDFDGNLDSVFCGIFPEEVAELEQNDDEYLRRDNVVPVMPAITCFRSE